MIADKPVYRHRLFRLITPLNDTILMVLGLTMVFTIGENIWGASWFQEKMAYLLLYIVFGTLALNRLDNKKMQIVAYIIALGFAGCMIFAARFKSALLIDLF